MPLPESYRVALLIICGAILLATAIFGVCWRATQSRRIYRDWCSGHDWPGDREGGEDCE